MLVAFLPRDNNYKWSLKPPISYGDPSGNDLQAQTKLWWRELLYESTHFTWSGGKSVLFGTQGLQFHLCYKHLFKVFSCLSISVFSSIKKAAAFLSSRLSPVLRCHLNSFLFPNTPLSRPQGLPDLLLDPVLPDLKRSFLWWSKGPATQVINWSQTTQKACPPLATSKRRQTVYLLPWATQPYPDIHTTAEYSQYLQTLFVIWAAPRIKTCLLSLSPTTRRKKKPSPFE